MHTQTITDKTYLSSLILKCIIIFAAGIVFSVFVLLLFMNQHTGQSYAASFKILFELRKEVISDSILIYSFTLFFTIFFIAMIALFYSHRVSGPLFRLNKYVNQLAEGNLGQEVRLRKKDAIHSLSAETNSMVSAYKGIILELGQTVAELKEIHSLPHSFEDENEYAKIKKRIKEKTEHISEIISKLDMEDKKSLRQ